MITARDISQFQDLGYFLTEPAFDQAQLDLATAEFHRLWELHIRQIEAGGTAQQTWIARNRAFIGQAHTRSAVLAAMCHAPVYRAACAALIGPNADLYYNQVVIKSPQLGAHFGWHQDSGYTITVPLRYVTCWTAISRTTLANGCIWIIPGSHHRGLLPHRHNQRDDSHDAVFENEQGAIPLEMRPGQVAVFSSLLLHRSGPNTSQENRFGFVPQYHHAGVLAADTGAAGGDQVPILRDGHAVDSQLTSVR